MHARFPWKKPEWVGLVGVILALACAGSRRASQEASGSGGVSESDRIGAALAAAPANYLASRWVESARALEAAAEEARASGDPRLPQVELEWGRLLADLGRTDRAAGDRALTLLSGLTKSPAGQRDPMLRAAALFQEGRVHYWRKLIQNEGEWERCYALFSESLALREAHGDTRGQAESLFYMGLVHQFQDGFKTAVPYFERSLARAREAGDALLQSFPLRHLGYEAEESGRLDEAVSYHREALALREQVGFRWGVMFQLIAVGDVLCVRKKDCAAAEPYYSRAAALARELNEPLAEVEARMGLGRVAGSRHDGPGARKHFEAALDAARRASDAESEAQAALALSEVLVTGGERAEARRVLEAARESLARTGQSDKGREVEAALARLGGS